MKPRWTIVRLWYAELHGYRPICAEHMWFWQRTDRNGVTSFVGCVGHHPWTKRVKAFEVVS